MSVVDVFEAVGSLPRRRVLEILHGGERSVNELAAACRLRQPAVSKHLRVLRQARLIRVRTAGRRRMYQIDGAGMKTLHDWAGGFAPFWEHQLHTIKAHAEAQQAAQQARPPADRQAEGDAQKGTSS